jgi:hypothetical protein
MRNLRNDKDLLVGAIICGAEVLVPAVITFVNFVVLR